MRESAGNFRAALNEAVVMLEHNRNLSSIVGTIQDEGPPTDVPGEPASMQPDMNTVGAVEADALVSSRSTRRRSGWRSFSYILFVAMLLAAVSIFVLGGREGSLAGNADSAGTGETVVSAIGGVQESNFNSQALQARQDAIMSRMEELSATIADIKADNDHNQPDRQGELNGQLLTTKHMEEMAAAIADIKSDNARYQLDNRNELKKIQQEFQYKIDKITAALALLQEGPDDQADSSQQPVKDSSDVNVEQSESIGVPARGEWVVNVVSSEHIEPVEKLMNKLRTRGIPAETQEVIVDGKVRYRLRIPGFATSDAAREYARNLDGDLGLKDPWISRR